MLQRPIHQLSSDRMSGTFAVPTVATPSTVPTMAVPLTGATLPVTSTPYMSLTAASAAPDTHGHCLLLSLAWRPSLPFLHNGIQ
jgi:hypothetical protein